MVQEMIESLVDELGGTISPSYGSRCFELATDVAKRHYRFENCSNGRIYIVAYPIQNEQETSEDLELANPQFLNVIKQFITNYPPLLLKIANECDNVVVEKGLPAGYVHVPGFRLGPKCRKAKIPYAPAVVGWAGTRNRPIPKFDGVVVEQRHAEQVRFLRAGAEAKRITDLVRRMQSLSKECLP